MRSLEIRAVWWCALLLLCLCGCQPRSDNALRGRVVGVQDGDTLTLLTADRRQVKIRLAEIDAPERRQPFGQRSRQMLAERVHGREVRLQVSGVDRYQRTVARAYLGELDVNREMVRLGGAWVYRAYNTDRSLLAVEEEARRGGAGLWALPEAQRLPPWQWRRRQSQWRDAASDGAPAVGAACPPAPACGKLHSCAEARRLLVECGATALDRDGDGVPCEVLCPQ